MADDCDHDIRVTVDTAMGPVEKCPICEDVDMQTNDGFMGDC
jgi:hypothetical protein